MYNKVCLVFNPILLVARDLFEIKSYSFLSYYCFILQYASKEFGTCPLVQCAGQPVLPVGLKDEMGADTVKIFCPKCQCVYHPPPIRSRSSHHSGAGAAGVDGAAFGTTFPHLFLMTFSNLVPDPLPQNSSYVPRVFGFRVHSSTRQRAGSAASTQLHASSSAVRQRDADNNKRSSFVGKRSDAAAKDDTKAKDFEAAEIPLDANAAQPPQEATTMANQKGKGPSVPTKQARGSNDDNPSKDDDGSRKSSKGKRKNDGDSGSRKSETNGSANLDNSPKRRRKAENVGG
jgi:hypothetical protein